MFSKNIFLILYSILPSHLQACRPKACMQFCSLLCVLCSSIISCSLNWHCNTQFLIPDKDVVHKSRITSFRNYLHAGIASILLGPVLFSALCPRKSCRSFYSRTILNNSRKGTLHFTAVTAFGTSMSSRNLLLEKCLGWDSSERPRSRKDDNIKMDLSEFCCDDRRLIETAHDPVDGQASLSGALNIRDRLLIVC